MDRGAWQVTVHMVAESDMTDLLLLAYSKGGNNLLDGNLKSLCLIRLSMAIL